MDVVERVAAAACEKRTSLRWAARVLAACALAGAAPAEADTITLVEALRRAEDDHVEAAEARLAPSETRRPSRIFTSRWVALASS